MIDICRKSEEIPVEHINKMIKMYKECSSEQQNSKKLMNLVNEAIHNIPLKKRTFDFAASVFNELLYLTNLQVSI